MEPMSDKPLAERLQVKPGRTLAVLEAPDGFDIALGEDRLGHPRAADVILLFVTDRARLEAALPPLLTASKPGAILWVAYPKLGSSLAGDLSRDVIRTLAPSFGSTR